MPATLTIERQSTIEEPSWTPDDISSSALPPPVERFVDLATPAQGGPIDTVVMTCEAWMRRPWLPPIPLQIRMSHRLGVAFVHEIRIGRGVLSYPIGLDAFVDGRGAMIVGRSIETGPSFDQGARIAMWGEALTFPASWLGRTDVGWESLDARTARFIVSSPEGDLPIDVSFDPRTELPTSCVADRYKGSGPLTRWYGAWTDWAIGPEGVLAPRRMQVRWADEPQPWLTIRVDRIAVDTPIDATIERARAALRAPIARARSAGHRRPT
jgi:hypothetical protein